MHLWTLLGQWIRARRTILLYTALVFLLFFTVYGLYGFPWEVAGYAALLCLVAGLIFAGVDGWRFMQKIRLLQQLPGRYPLGELPLADNLLEESYSLILQSLEEERKKLEIQTAEAGRDADEYYALWTHQIKTPIAAMRLLLQSSQLKMDKGSKTHLAQELFRIEQYVDMVLQYQRLSSLQSDLLFQRHNLDVLVKTAAKNCATMFIHKGLPLQVQGVTGSVITDQKWFVFVLEQLYTNALKYTAAGGEVRVYSQNPSTLVVEDTGIGIPPEELPRVFERGFTGAVGRSERSSTGIGLYLCRRIMERLGFGITIESVLGEGTRVLLHLEQHPAELDEV